MQSSSKKAINIKSLAEELVGFLSDRCFILDLCIEEGADEDLSNNEYLLLEYYFLIRTINGVVKNQFKAKDLQLSVTELFSKKVSKSIDFNERFDFYDSIVKNYQNKGALYKIGETYSELIGIPDSVAVATGVGLAIGETSIILAKFLEKVLADYKLI